MHHVCHLILLLYCYFSSSEKQIEIRSNESRFCGFRNCEFFGVNVRNELLKSFIIERDKIVNIMVTFGVGWGGVG